MLVDAIQAELIRLQLHPANLSASSTDDRAVALHGSLLQYWSLPHSVEAEWLLAQLESLPNDAGPQAVMTKLVAEHGQISESADPSQPKAQLRLFDPQNKIPMK